MSLTIGGDEFTLDEVIYMLDLTHKLPLSKNDISVENIKKTINDNTIANSIHNFLEDEYSKVTEQTYFKIVEPDKSISTQLMRSNYLTGEPGKELIIDENTDTIAKKQRKVAEHYTIPFRQGLQNPIYRNTEKHTIAVDSENRQYSNKINIEEMQDCSGSTNQDVFQEGVSTDFTYELDPKITNVVDMTLVQAQIPLDNMHIISEKYGTNAFRLSRNKDSDGNYIDYENTGNNFNIPSGRYQNNINNVVTALNDLSGSTNLQFEYLSNSNKIKITNKDTSSVSINWFYEQTINICDSQIPGYGSKINYNLGWLLGFKTLYSEIPGSIGSNTITASSGISQKIKGDGYLFVSVDDFNNNKPNTDLITTISSADQDFKMPSYYNKATMSQRILEKCDGEIYDSIIGTNPNDINNRRCSDKPVNNAHIKSITRNQQFSIAQLENAKKTVKTNRYSIPSVTDYIAKIQYTSNENTINWIKDNTNTTRNYFGPITLKKMTIKIIDEYGNVIDLNDDKISLTFEVTKIYQF